MQFTYVDNNKQQQTIAAPDAATAIKTAPNIDPHSGVGPVPLTDTGATTGVATGGTAGAGNGTGGAATPAQAYKGLSVGSPAPLDGALSDAIARTGTVANNPIDESTIYQNKLSQYQSEIDATNKIYADMLAKAKVQGVSNLGSGRAIQARSGTLGSDFGFAQTDKINEANTATEASIQAEQQAKIAGILGLARKDAADEIAAKRTAQQQGLTDYINYLGQQGTRRAANIAKIAGGILDQGLTIDSIDPTQLSTIAKSYGLTVDDIKQAVATEAQTRAKAKAEADAKAIKDNSFNLSEGQSYYAYDPKTGGYTLIASKAKTYAPKSGSGDGDGGSGGENPQLYSGLNSKTATAIRAKVAAFKTEPIVQNYATIQEGRNFAGSLSNDTQNPADDQGLIYSLAKALDPGSVVREGEYATAQKYAQSWVAAYGKGVTQALLGTGFLSKQARENIKNTIETKYQASKRSYDNVYNQYGTGINALSGRSDGKQFLIDYSTPAPASTDTTDPNAGKLHVRLSGGQTGYIDPTEYDAKTMEKI